MIRIEHLVKRFGQQVVLDDVSLVIPEGQVLGLLGPNGAGKSTLMKIMLGLWHPTSCATLEVSRSIGYLPELNPLYPEMYVREYLTFFARLRDSKEDITALIHRVGLDAEAHKRIGELSKGYRQRLGLAQALIGNPQLLILDEPTTGLDPNQLDEIRALIRQLGRDHTVILSTHILQEVGEMCDRVVILDHGRVTADQPTDEIYDLKALFRESTYC